MGKDRILVGRFGAPRGGGGELRLTSFTGVPGAIGGGDILEIACPDSCETMLLPFRKEIFPRVAIAAGNLTVVPPAAIEAKPSER